MKKMLSIILALVLCLSAVSAIAEAASSITADDLIDVEEQVEGLELSLPEDQTAADEQLKALTEAASIEEYFGDEAVADATVDELFAIAVEEVPAEAAELIPVSFKASKEYKDGDEVIVMIGVVNGENVEWTAFNGVAEGNKVTIEVEPEFLNTLKEATVLVAILSK